MADGMDYELVFIGGGTAAIAGVTEALELGAERVAIVEQRRGFGGECEMNGCVPIHTMMAGVNLFHEFRRGDDFGINVPPLHLDFRLLTERVQRVVKDGLENPFAGNPRVTAIHGHARFVSPHALEITGESRTMTITGEHIVLCTGAQPVIPDIPGLKEAGFMLYPQAVHAKTLPVKMAVLGGGRLGCEFAQIFQRLGCRVTLIEVQDRLLSREDADSCKAVRQVLEDTGVKVLTGTELVSVELVSPKPPQMVSPKPQMAPPNPFHELKRLTCLNREENPLMLDVDELLVTVGRRGNPADLNPEAAGIAVEHSGLLINEQCRTTVPHIWAAGDVAGPFRFTHTADAQAVVAVQNIFGLTDRRVSYDCLPIAYYLDPPLARVGLTETQARENFESVVVLRAFPEQVSRYRLEDKLEGFCKILVDGETDLILGAHMMADQADSIIHIPALAMRAGIHVQELTRMIYAYPTKAQLVQKTLETYRHRKVETLKSRAGVG